MNIVDRDKVAMLYAWARAQGLPHAEACEAVAASLCLPAEAVDEAVAETAEPSQ